MKRYEFLFLTALVTLLFSMLCPLACDGGRITDPLAPKAPRVVAAAAACQPMRETFFMRSRCEGYIAVDQRRDRRSRRTKNKVILLQRTGSNGTLVTESHPLARMVKETCSPPAVRAGGRKRWRRRHELIRYRHETSDKYICFDTRGNIRAVDARRVARKGRLCMFEEQQINEAYHVVRSAHNAAWHLDFNPERRSRRGLAPRRGPRSSHTNCHAQFHSGQLPRPDGSGSVFAGILSQLENDANRGVAAANDLVVLGSISGDKNPIAAGTTTTTTTTLDTKAVVINSVAADNGHPYNNNNIVDVGGVKKILSRAHLEALKAQHILSRKKDQIRIRHLMKKNWRLGRSHKRRNRQLQRGGRSQQAASGIRTKKQRLQRQRRRRV